MNLYIEAVFTRIKEEGIRNHPNPHVFNINGVITWYHPQTKTHLFWLGGDLTGLAYHEFTEGMANIYPYYFGIVFKEVQLYRWTDLYKPKTEKEFLDSLYKMAYNLNTEFENVSRGTTVDLSFEDYMFRLRRVLYWMSYLNSTKSV